MIRVTVELIPHGDESRKRIIGSMEIANDCTSDVDFIGHYKGTMIAEYTGPKGRSGRVTHFRRQNQSVWTLIGAFLKLFGHTGHSPKFLEKVD